MSDQSITVQDTAKGRTVTFGEKKDISELESYGEGMPQRLIACTFVVGVNEADEDYINNLVENFGQEIAHHLLHEQMEKTIVVDWQELQELDAKVASRYVTAYRESLQQAQESAAS